MAYSVKVGLDWRVAVLWAPLTGVSARDLAKRRNVLFGSVCAGFWLRVGCLLALYSVNGA